MTTLELIVTNLAKHEYSTVDAYVDLVNQVNVVKKHQQKQNSSSVNMKTVLKNYRSNANRRNKLLLNIIKPVYDMFVELKSEKIFTKYIIWWTYEICKDEQIRKYSDADLLNERLMTMFIDWLDGYVNSLNILAEFNRSCAFVTAGCINGKTAKDVISDLIKKDKLATAVMTGNLSMYALATIPTIVVKTFDFKHSIFSKQLFNTISGNRDYLLGMINHGCQNVVNTPVNFLNYVDNKIKTKTRDV